MENQIMEIEQPVEVEDKEASTKIFGVDKNFLEPIEVQEAPTRMFGNVDPNFLEFTETELVGFTEAELVGFQ